MPRKKPSSMGKLAAETARKVDDELLEEELGLLLRTTVDWESLRPEVTDPEIYNLLIAAVNESTNKNEDIAQLHRRIKKLGKEALSLAKKVVSPKP